LLQAERFTDAALDAISLGGRCGVLARHQNSQPCLAFAATRQEERVTRQAAPRPLPQQLLECTAARQPPPGIQSKALARRGYNPSRRRPRDRRFRNTLRPPGVRLRTRNPWRRARRVFDGW
jgi:hypothetical protein